jgi:periplasmic protein TonB
VPPPPPPPSPPPPEQKMIEQPTKEVTPEFKEDKPLDQPKDEPKDAKNQDPPGHLSLDAKATGPGDLFNLGGKPGGSPYGGGGGGGGSYAGMVNSQVQAALSANKKTRYAAFRTQIRLWADETGRVTRVVVSTGNAELDADIREALMGLVLHSPPPKDKPLPLVTQVSETRPN